MDKIRHKVCEACGEGGLISYSEYTGEFIVYYDMCNYCFTLEVLVEPHKTLEEEGNVSHP